MNDPQPRGTCAHPRISQADRALLMIAIMHFIRKRDDPVSGLVVARIGQNALRRAATGTALVLIFADVPHRDTELAARQWNIGRLVPKYWTSLSVKTGINYYLAFFLPSLISSSFLFPISLNWHRRTDEVPAARGPHAARTVPGTGARSPDPR